MYLESGFCITSAVCLFILVLHFHVATLQANLLCWCLFFSFKKEKKSICIHKNMDTYKIVCAFVLLK